MRKWSPQSGYGWRTCPHMWECQPRSVKIRFQLTHSSCLMPADVVLRFDSSYRTSGLRMRCAARRHVSTTPTAALQPDPRGAVRCDVVSSAIVNSRGQRLQQCDVVRVIRCERALRLEHISHLLHSSLHICSAALSSAQQRSAALSSASGEW